MDRDAAGGVGGPDYDGRAPRRVAAGWAVVKHSRLRADGVLAQIDAMPLVVNEGRCGMCSEHSAVFSR